MVDKITVPTFEQIETILTKLATNYSNLAIVFYDIFYNTTPMDVTLQMYDEEGVLQTYTIPNRAKDMSNILNGEGSPEGNIEAGKGIIYQDLSNGKLYIKVTSSGETGWTNFVTNSELQDILIEGVGSPEGVVIADKGALYVDRANAALYIKTQDESNTGWLLISANTASLANKNLDNLTSTGEAHFANPSLSNLNSTGQSKFNAKENISNKVTSISGSSTDTQYPSAKAVKDLVSTNVNNLANKDLSNISSIGESKFLGINKIIEGVLAAPIIMYRGTANSFTLPTGTVLLCANGLKTDNSINNIIIQITQNLVGAVPTIADSEGYIFYDDMNKILRTPTTNKYFYTVEEPVVVSGGVWFNPVECTYYIVANVDDTDEWIQVPAAKIGKWSTDSNGAVATFEPFYPLRVVNSQSKELDHVVIETGGTETNWYRLYKDGWLEAGGYLTGGGTVNLLKEFSSAHYTLVPSANATSFTKSAGSFTLTVTSGSAETDWMAKGWAATW